MNILFFNRSFYPDTEATGQFLTELCEDLVSYGHNVCVIAGKSSQTNEKYKLFFVRQENHKSIEILRIGGTTFPKKYLALRIINLATYFILAFIGGFFVKSKPDVVIVQTDPPVLGLLGIFFSKWHKAKFIYSCKDLYPEVGIITGKLTNPFLNYLLKIINLFSFRLADKVICLGESMKKLIVNKGIDESKISIIHDWADTRYLYPVSNEQNPFREKYKLSNYFTVMYSGNIGLTQGLEKLIELASHFKHKREILFILIGDGVLKNKLIEDAKNLNLTNIMFLPYQSKEELKFSLSAPDVHLITSQKGLSGVIVPSKIYGILACSKPFLAWIDRDNEVAKVAQRYKSGIIVPPGNVRSMIRAVNWISNHRDLLTLMGNNGRNAAEKEFDRKVSISKFNSILSELCNSLTV